MVCKEDVKSWFKDLEGYKRIDLLYELLTMCVPFELRFIGSCIEELGKHSYSALRSPAIVANDLDRLTKDPTILQGLFNESVRHKLILFISLLTSRNYSVASWLYKNVLRTDGLEECFVKNVKDETAQSEFLLLFIMALLHPAFNFEQKLYFDSILHQLRELKEAKRRLSPKPSAYGYPPGFGYPTLKMNNSEVPIVPAKAPVRLQCSDETIHQSACVPPQEYIQWNFPPGIHCGAPPEVPPPFPLTNTSPLVSESTSPNHSRSGSPHRIPSILSNQMPSNLLQRPLEVLPTQLPIDSLSSNNFTFIQPLETEKIEGEDPNLISDDKFIDGSWMINKQQNGIRFGTNYTNNQRNFVDQFQASLSLDGENSIHRSNSSSSSSLTHTPPETPTTTSQPHGRDNIRTNGIQSFMASAQLPLCDTTSPPPPHTQTFSNCSVPYTTYAPFGAAIPTRSIFPYNTYRPPFTAHFPSSYQTNDTSFPTYSFSMMPIIYSSQYPSRNPNCYNCGAMGHVGQDCTIQSIEDITLKKTYTIEYAAPSDADKS